jgi:hypothetical protein
MKISNIFVPVAAVAAFGFTACKKDAKFTVSNGDADFSKYVAIGNSLTAGYADNALYYDAQMVSYPSMMARQFMQVGGGEFNQPLVPESSVGIGNAGNARLALAIVNGALTPRPIAASGDMTIFSTSVASKGPFNNMGVPGAKVTTAVYPGYGNPANGTGNYNPFFTRMTSAPATASILTDAVAQKPTFFTVFLGSNDVLGYALSGGAGDAITPMEGPAGVGFAASYETLIGALTAGGAKGAVANVADVTTAPYFTTIPYNALVLTRQGQADSLNAAYAPLIQANLVAQFKIGPNGFIIADAESPVGIRQMEEGELVLLSTPQDSLKLAGWGSSKPIANQYVLTAKELGNIREATANYNSKIKEIAVAKNLAYVDIASFLSGVKENGIEANGRKITTTFVTGGAFSLDGIHLTPIGSAFLANEFIKTINSTYNAAIPQVDYTKYGGVKFP